MPHRERTVHGVQGKLEFVFEGTVMTHSTQRTGRAFQKRAQKCRAQCAVDVHEAVRTSGLEGCWGVQKFTVDGGGPEGFWTGEQ